ncbi:MAG: fasciclin domain-containing protein [Gemmatimonadales bacterium]
MKPFRSLALAALLLAPVTAVAQDAQGYAPEATASGDIIETATAAGSFTTLAKALQAAGLVETLKGKGPFTVFAPTDEAFAKLPEGTLDALLKDKQQLTAILTYHVVPGNVSAAQVATLTSAKTVNGKELSIAAKGGTVTVGNATVTQADIPATNGVIHVIDTVLLPE